MFPEAAPFFSPGQIVLFLLLSLGTTLLLFLTTADRSEPASKKQGGR